MNGKPNHIDQTAALIRRQWDRPVDVGIVLGTGLGDLSTDVRVEATFSYDDLPEFPSSTALGHRGRFVCGTLRGLPVFLMDGRCHVYEGYTLAEITRPIRLMNALGIGVLVATNAAGGLNPRFATGDIVAVEDHIDMMCTCDALGRNQTWDRLPACHSVHIDRLEAYPTKMRARRANFDGLQCGAAKTPHYDRELLLRACEMARHENVALHTGVYIAMTGPCYETRAEYRFLRRIGGDVVGMSTVPEVTVARQCGMRCLALSIVTNVAKPDVTQPVDAEDVIAVAEQTGDNVLKIVLGLISTLGGDHRDPP